MMSNEKPSYRPLNVSRREIRVVRVKPSTDYPPSGSLSGVDIFCELEHRSLTEKPDYTAISYVWGDVRDSRLISVDGKAVRVTRNLEEVLRHLRKDDEELTMWIDALCINQEDEEEKSQQVRHMNEIYAQARQTISWIGPAANDSDIIMAQLQQIYEDICALNLETEFHVLGRYDSGLYTKFPTLYDKWGPQSIYVEAWDRLTLRSYWARVWIVQEVAVSQNLDIVCGKARISVAGFVTVTEFMKSLYPGIFKRINHLLDLAERDPAIKSDETLRREMTRLNVWTGLKDGSLLRVFSVRHIYQMMEGVGVQLGIVTMLLGSKYRFEATNPSDRIYSVIGLVHELDSKKITIDYKKPFEDVYSETAKIIISKGHVREILPHCSVQQRIPGLPTWTPDWRQPGEYKSIVSNYDASANLNFQDLTQSSPKILSLNGVTVDSVKFTGKLWEASVDIQNYLSEIRDCCSRSTRLRSSKIDDAAFRVPIADRTSDANTRFSTTGSIRASNEYRDAYYQFTQSDKAVDITDIDRVDKRYETDAKSHFGRRPIITNSGYVGLGPENTSNGDVVCIFAGGRIPFVLREKAVLDIGKVYELVGDAYLYEIMDGEISASSLGPEIFHLV